MDNNIDMNNTINNDVVENNLISEFEEIGILIPEILLPTKNVDLKNWSVVACDQYTSQDAYWETIEKLVINKPSTLKIMLPEIYLEKPDVNDRIKKINETMKEYQEKGILVKETQGFIYVNRKTIYTQSRKGLIVALDLERYDYAKSSQTLIRATEGTVVERLPPRIRIRENATIELPHIMVLIDDPEKTVIEPLEWKATQNHSPLKKVYDFDLMMNGGHIKGYKVEDENILRQICDGLKNLADKNNFKKKYNISDDTKGVLLYAMGDGNHSLATAKAIWEEKKKGLSKEEQKNHPARYALVELVNVHDEGLRFEPIHRVVFNINKSDNILNKSNNNFFDEMKSFFDKNGSEFLLDKEENILKYDDKKVHKIRYITNKNSGIIIIKDPKSNLEVGTLQSFLDSYTKNHPDTKIDYIHGDDVVKELGSIENNIGFFLPAMPKTELFKTVILDGVLPRKTFSMGEAEEKRFYLEARQIKK